MPLPPSPSHSVSPSALTSSFILPTSSLLSLTGGQDETLSTHATRLRARVRGGARGLLFRHEQERGRERKRRGLARGVACNADAHRSRAPAEGQRAAGRAGRTGRRPTLAQDSGAEGGRDRQRL